MAPRFKIARELVPGDVVLCLRPSSRATITHSREIAQQTFNGRGIKIGTHAGWELRFRFNNGDRRGQADYVIGRPEDKVVLG